VNFKNGNNISITNTGKEITIATNPDLTADSLTINNGGPVINGNGINMGDKKITNVADGDVTATSKDAVNGSQLYATNQNVANNTANIAKGFNFGDGNTANNYQLGDTISVKGDNNVTSTTVNGGVQLGLNQNLSLTSVTTGNTKMDNNGLTINGGPSVTTNGVDAGGKKITNVAAGEADTDAVNVGQLNQKLGAIAGANTAHVAALEQKINNVEDEADAGTASAMATAGPPPASMACKPRRLSPTRYTPRASVLKRLRMSSTMPGLGLRQEQWSASVCGQNQMLSMLPPASLARRCIFSCISLRSCMEK